ncbi:MAG: prepilin-type N-terminal cleavage/methylation domain-containing protein [Planctomycetota bacterium]
MSFKSPRISRPPHADRRGFTLVEVLATLLLVGVVLPVIVRATGSSAQLGVWSQRSATAAALADAKLNELIITDDWANGDADGTFDIEAYGPGVEPFYWALTTEDWNATDFTELSLTVSWEDGRGERSVTLTTVINSPDIIIGSGGAF